MPRPVAVIVLSIAVVINAFSFAASQLWVSPDASYYVELAGGLADHFDIRSQLFLIRPPGYPIFLAIIFRLFGAASPTAIMTTQHLMVVAVCYLIALIAWRITRQSWSALLAGLMTACSLQLITYANLIMTEVPFTLATVWAIYHLVAFHQTRKCHHLALASLLTGVSYTFRPIGMALLPLCALVAASRELQFARIWGGVGYGRAKDMGARGSGQAASLGGRGSGRAAFVPEGRSENSPAFSTLGQLCSKIRSAVGTTEQSPGGRRATALEQSVFNPRVSAFRRLGVSAFCAVAPAFAVYLPCLLQNQLLHGGDLSTRCADLALYFRIVYMDKLDSTHSVALNDIRGVVAEAREKKLLPDNADYRLWGSVWQAYEKTRGLELADSSRVMGRAARDLIAEHPLAVLDGTIRYALWMILVPDGFYRFHPGGAPGIRSADGECKRNPNASILAADTYEPMMRPWTGPYAHYLPLRSDATALTPWWSGLARGFYERIENGPSILGLGDTPYEFFGWLCLAGMCASLLVPQRGAYLIVIAAVALPVVVSAFLAGPTPRYAVPVRPLLLLFPSLPFVALASVFRKVYSERTSTSSTRSPVLASMVSTLPTPGA